MNAREWKYRGTICETRKEGQPALFTIASWMEQYDELTAGFTSRHGGVSEAPYSTLNCGLHVLDKPEHVIRNRELLAEAIGQPFEAFTYAEQVHGNEVTVVSLQEKGIGRTSRESAIQAKDGFITNEKGIMICAQFADCVPLFSTILFSTSWVFPMLGGKGQC